MTKDTKTKSITTQEDFAKAVYDLRESVNEWRSLDGFFRVAQNPKDIMAIHVELRRNSDESDGAPSCHTMSYDPTVKDPVADKLLETMVENAQEEYYRLIREINTTTHSILTAVSPDE